MDSNKQNGHFLGSVCDAFVLISVVCGGSFPEQNCVGVICVKVTIRPIGTRSRNINFVETGSTGRMDSIVIRYSVTSSANGGEEECI
jgi:hypothetical protein